MGASSRRWSRLRNALEFVWWILFYHLLPQNQGVNWDPVTYCHLPPDSWVVQREVITAAFLKDLSYLLILIAFVEELETDFATACVLEKIRKIVQPFPHCLMSPFSLLSVEVVVWLSVPSLLTGEIAFTYKLSRRHIALCSHPLHPPSPVSLWTENKVDAVKNLIALQTLLCLTFTLHCQNAEFSQLFSSKQLQCKSYQSTWRVADIV